MCNNIMISTGGTGNIPLTPTICADNPDVGAIQSQQPPKCRVLPVFPWPPPPEPIQQHNQDYLASKFLDNGKIIKEPHERLEDVELKLVEVIEQMESINERLNIIVNFLNL